MYLITLSTLVCPSLPDQEAGVVQSEGAKEGPYIKNDVVVFKCKDADNVFPNKADSFQSMCKAGNEWDQPEIPACVKSK